ncbi:recombinase family protein [Aerococcaceae bacterium NML180378]|nr:recombinase family protein [Aerococcaceae bacterium NML180378]
MKHSTLTIPHWSQVDFSEMENLTILYARLSAEDGNEGESNSIMNQKMILTKFAESHQFDSIVFFDDDGFSGSNFNRPAITKALELVEASKVRNFIVKDLSRLGRDYLKTGQLLEFVFPNHNVRFLSINEQVDSAKASSQDAYMLPLVNLFNEWYSRQCSEKIRLSKRTKAKNGERIGWQAPYGYLNHPDNRKEWLVDEIAAKVIQRIFSEYVAGRTPSEIAHGLRRDKIRTPHFHKKHLGLNVRSAKIADEFVWRSEQVGKIIDREEYIGSTVNLRTEKTSHKMRGQRRKPQSEWLVFKNTHPAIVSQEVFDTARRMRSHKRVVQRHKWVNQPGHENLFAGLMYCEHGHKLTFCPLQRNTRNLDHYKCAHYDRVADTCSNRHYIRKTVLQKTVLEDIRQLIDSVRSDKARFETQLREQYEWHSQKHLKSQQKHLLDLQARYKQIDQIIATLYEDRISGHLTAERFNKLSVQYDNEQSSLKVEIEKLSTTLQQQADNNQNIDRFLKLIEQYPTIEQLTPEIINNFIQRIIVKKLEGCQRRQGTRLEIQYNFIEHAKTERD